MDIPRSGSFCPLISSRMTFAKLVFGFVEGGKLEDTEKKNPWSKEENQQQTQPTRCFSGPGIEPGP